MRGSSRSSIYPRFLVLLILPLLLVLPVACIAEEDFEIVSFSTSDGGSIEASMFPADGKRVAILAHGAVFDKESWYPLCESLQTAGVNALSIDFRGYGNSTAGSSSDKSLDVLGAIAYLEAQGFDDIAVIGGSMGGAATLDALAKTNSTSITKAVLLAPAGGAPIANEQIDKLFIVAEGDRLSTRVKSLHDESTSPKQLKVYDGDAHAQHLFKTEHADDLTKTIVDFLRR